MALFAFVGFELSQLVIAWLDVEGLEIFASAIRKIHSQDQFGQAAYRAINRTGNMARTQVVRALAKQTALPQKLIRYALKRSQAYAGRFEYQLSARGGDISLKFFSPRETRRGVTAKLPGGRKVFAGTFMKGGRFPNRVGVSAFNGHVYQRQGGSRFPIARVKSGVIIPVEMVRGETARAFHQSVRVNLPRRFAHEISRLTCGVFS